MMPPREELSADLKDAIIRHFQRRNSYINISTAFGVPRSTVHHWVVACWKDNHINYKDRAAAKVGVITKVKPASTQETIKEDLAAVGVCVSKSTVMQALNNIGMAAHCPHKAPLKSRKHLAACLKFAWAHINNSHAQWDKVLWSDETKIELFGHNTTKMISNTTTTPSTQQKGSRCGSGRSIFMSCSGPVNLRTSILSRTLGHHSKAGLMHGGLKTLQNWRPMQGGVGQHSL